MPFRLDQTLHILTDLEDEPTVTLALWLGVTPKRLCYLPIWVHNEHFCLRAGHAEHIRKLTRGGTIRAS